MVFSVGSSAAAIKAAASLYEANKIFNDSAERLSSGKKLNSAADNVGSVSKASRIKSEIVGLERGAANALEFQKVFDISDSTQAEISNLLQQIREKALYSLNSSLASSDKNILQTEIKDLINSIETFAKSNTYNGKNLLDGSFVGKTVYVGNGDHNYINVSIPSAKTSTIGQYYLSGASHLKGGATGSAAVNDVTSQTLTLNGNGSVSVSIANGSSAKTASSAINGVDTAVGIKASASNKIKIDNLQNLASNKGVSFKIGTTQIATTVVTSGDITSLIGSINAYSGTTGVTATNGSTNSEIFLSNDDGADILIDDFLTSNTADSTATIDVTSINPRTDAEVGSAVQLSHQIASSSQVATVDSVLSIGQLELGYHKDFSISGHGATSTLLVQSNSISSSFVSGISVTSSTNAKAAIKTVEFALDNINEARSRIASNNNRLDFSNELASKNAMDLKISLSQLVDADFVKETLNLSKAQIIRDNAAAMLVQANASMFQIRALLY